MDKKKLLSSCHLNNVQLLKKLSQLAWSPEEQWNKKNNSQRWWRGLWWSVHVTLCVGLKCLQYANKKAKTISALRGTACPTVWGWYLIMNSSMGCLTSLRQWKELYKSSLLQVLLIHFSHLTPLRDLGKSDFFQATKTNLSQTLGSNSEPSALQDCQTVSDLWLIAYENNVFFFFSPFTWEPSWSQAPEKDFEGILSSFDSQDSNILMLKGISLTVYNSVYYFKTNNSSYT